MKNIKILPILLFLIVSTVSFAQQDKLKQKAIDLVTELNENIVKSDAALALTDQQKEKITELHIARLKESRKVKKANATKEEMKAVNKKYYKQIFSEVLTKEQRLANKEGKADKEK